MSEQMRPLEESATHALDGLASRWNAWLRRTDSLEMVVEIEALGERVTCANRVLRKTGLLRRLMWVEDGVPDALVHDAVALRGATTRADGAAWTWAFLSISTRDGELTTDFDYERRPDLVPPCTRDDCAAEQRLFPRDSGRLPGWMARLQSDEVEGGGLSAPAGPPRPAAALDPGLRILVRREGRSRVRFSSPFSLSWRFERWQSLR